MGTVSPPLKCGRSVGSPTGPGNENLSFRIREHMKCKVAFIDYIGGLREKQDKMICACIVTAKCECVDAFTSLLCTHSYAQVCAHAFASLLFVVTFSVYTAGAVGRHANT